MKERTIQSLLKKHKLRRTPARSKILELYLDRNHALSHKEIEDVLSDSHDRVTIYRTLSTFEEKGIIHRVFDNNPSIRYALCGTECNHDHHHDNHIHFNCISCNKTYCLEHVQLPHIQIPSSFKTNKIHFFAEGICEACR